MTRFLLVATEADLDRSREEGIFCAIKLIPGVSMVADMSIISQETLDTILLKPTARLAKAEPTIFNAIRNFHRRRRQPELL